MAEGYSRRLVLQISKECMESADHDPRKIVSMLYHYVGTIDDILLDLSGGLGRHLDREQSRRYLSAIAEIKAGGCRRLGAGYLISGEATRERISRIKF